MISFHSVHLWRNIYIKCHARLITALYVSIQKCTLFLHVVFMWYTSYETSAFIYVRSSIDGWFPESMRVSRQNLLYIAWEMNGMMVSGSMADNGNFQLNPSKSYARCIVWPDRGAQDTHQSLSSQSINFAWLYCSQKKSQFSARWLRQ